MDLFAYILYRWIVVAKRGQEPHKETYRITYSGLLAAHRDQTDNQGACNILT